MARGIPADSPYYRTIVERGPPWGEDPYFYAPDPPECPMFYDCDTLPEGRVCGRDCPEFAASLDADPEP